MKKNRFLRFLGLLAGFLVLLGFRLAKNKSKTGT